jgi:hypothetical protein
MLYLQSPHKKFYNRRAAANERYGIEASPDWSSQKRRSWTWNIPLAADVYTFDQLYRAVIYFLSFTNAVVTVDPER